MAFNKKKKEASPRAPVAIPDCSSQRELFSGI